MKTLYAVLFSILTLFSTNVNSKEFTGSFNDMLVTFYTTQCVTPVILDMLKPEFRASFKQGKITAAGNDYALCWTNDPKILKLAAIPPGTVFVIDETGDNGGLPVSIFGKENQNKI